MGNVISYNLDKEIEEQLVFELAILSAFMVKDELETERMFDITFPSCVLGGETKGWIYEYIINADEQYNGDEEI